MAWRFPVYPIENKQVVDVQQFNENFLCVVEEASGRLNEHNFSATAGPVLTRDQLTNDAAYRLHYSTPIPPPNVNAYGARANWVPIEPLDSWQTFRDTTDSSGVVTESAGLRLDYVGVGGTTWICASFNVHAGLDEEKELQKGFGYLFALEVDGVLINESLIGSGDLDQEMFSLGRKLDAPSPADLNEPQGGGGIAGARLPIVLNAVVTLLPGDHIIRVAILNLRGRMRADVTGGPQETWVSTRELFALELIR